MNKAKANFTPGEWVIFDGKDCQVFEHHSAGLALRIAMPGGWFRFQPLDWSLVQKKF
jgi:hypothetical protein